jgi:hypothetical protein
VSGKESKSFLTRRSTNEFVENFTLTLPDMPGKA